MAQPVQHHLMTLEEFSALPEDDSARYELQEGVLIVTARPARPHQRAVLRLARRIEDRLPAGWEVLVDFTVVVDEREPGTVRVPDLVITRIEGNEQELRGGDVALAVEVVSPGSRKVDRLLKAYEYAEAGIPQYWIVDLEPPSVTVCTLGAEGYDRRPPESGTLWATVELDGPVDLAVDVAALAGDNSG
jgi:Uma2 family endonuclease